VYILLDNSQKFRLVYAYLNRRTAERVFSRGHAQVRKQYLLTYLNNLHNKNIPEIRAVVNRDKQRAYMPRCMSDILKSASCLMSSANSIRKCRYFASRSRSRRQEFNRLFLSKFHENFI